MEVNRDYDIPYLAGYAKDNPRKLYMDRGIPTRFVLDEVRQMDVIPTLVIHEAIEKGLIDEFQFHERLYLRTHQIAQRLEKAAVESYGITWNDYQHGLMKKEIARVIDMGLNINLVPADLDLTPYIDFSDWDLIKKMKEVMQPKGTPR